MTEYILEYLSYPRQFKTVTKCVKITNDDIKAE